MVTDKDIDELVISIHAPREGCDPFVECAGTAFSKFQSTHPVRGATSRAGGTALYQRDFNPRTP